MDPGRAEDVMDKASREEMMDYSELLGDRVVTILTGGAVIRKSESEEEKVE